MFRKLTLFCIFLAFSLIVLGAYVRLSEAGLGCPDWPGCYGKIIVPESAEAVQQAQKAYPKQVFEADKAWKEMAHRYLAGALGIFILLLATMAWWVKHAKAAAVGLTMTLLALVILQVFLGMWTVTLRLMPVTVTAHLVVGMVTLGTLFWLYLRTSPSMPRTADGKMIRWSARIGLCILLLQITLGGWTSSNYAGLACPDFPTCLGRWWPPVDYAQAFAFWKNMGAAYQGRILPFDARAAIHWVHRLGAAATFIVLFGVAIGVSSNQRFARLSKAGVLLSFLLFAQIGLGVALVMLRMPVALAVSHNGLAALLLLNLIYINFYAGRAQAVERVGAAEEAAQIPERPAYSQALAPPQGGMAEAARAEAIPVTPEIEMPLPKEPEGLYTRLKNQLTRTRSGLTGFLAQLPVGKKAIDEDLLEELEAALLMADVGVDASAEIIRNLTATVQRHQLNDGEALQKTLRENLLDMLMPCSQPLKIPSSVRPFVILVVGVNGVGKTTTIGKLAKRLQFQGYSVMLAAGDTFRAAAVEQLQTWGERNRIPVIAQHTGADAASVIYDALQAAKARGADVLIADTAGRLHTKSNLMEELKKITRIMAKLDETAPHEVLLVLDAGTGQNALAQAKQFNQAVGLTGIALTKLDGTAKGGVIFALAKQFGIPIRYIGIGEGIDDLQDFDAQRFVDALFASEKVEAPRVYH